MDKVKYLQNIKENIESKGYYITTVLPCPQPSFVYTIGLTTKIGYEIVFCGGANYAVDELKMIIDSLYKKDIETITIGDFFEIDGFGKFKLSLVNESWNKRILLGVYDYFNIDNITSYQIVPEEKNKLLDVPDMSLNWENKDPIWRWIEDDWPYSIPSNSKIITNFQALKGETITEVTRWEKDEWEMFAGAGPEVDEKDIRIIPFATLLGIDSSIEKSMNLEIGKGLWRESKEDHWHDWGNS
jgi:hypothetical protein